MLDTYGQHSLSCEVGGGVNHRHNRVRDWLASWISSCTGQHVLTEQFVPKWDRVVRRGGEQIIERARLDVVFNDRHGRRAYVDVCIPTAATTCPELARARAARAGAAASRAEDQKRVRYNGPDLIPFAVEALGRPGSSTLALLRSLAPEEPSERSQVLGAAWQTLSVIIQLENAELLMAAATSR